MCHSFAFKIQNYFIISSEKLNTSLNIYTTSQQTITHVLHLLKLEERNVLSLFMTLLWSSVGTMQSAGEDSDGPSLPDLDKGMR